MRLDRLLPQRLRTLGPEMAKFSVIGGLNVLVNWVAFNLLLLLPAFANGQLKAKVIATGIAIVSSYYMNRHWTYKDRDKSAAHREFVLFLGFNLAGMLIELAVMAMTKYVFGLTSWLAINAAFIVGLALGTVFRFFTYRTWVFTHAEQTVEEAVEPAAAAMGLDPEGFKELTADLEREFAADKREVSGAVNGKVATTANGQATSQANGQTTSQANGKASGHANSEATGEHGEAKTNPAPARSR